MFKDNGIFLHFLEIFPYVLPPVNGGREGGQVNLGNFENRVRAVSLAAGFSVVNFDCESHCRFFFSNSKIMKCMWENICGIQFVTEIYNKMWQFWELGSGRNLGEI